MVEEANEEVIHTTHLTKVIRQPKLFILLALLLQLQLLYGILNAVFIPPLRLPPAPQPLTLSDSLVNLQARSSKCITSKTLAVAGASLSYNRN